MNFVAGKRRSDNNKLRGNAMRLEQLSSLDEMLLAFAPPLDSPDASRHQVVLGNVEQLPELTANIRTDGEFIERKAVMNHYHFAAIGKLRGSGVRNGNDRVGNLPDIRRVNFPGPHPAFTKRFAHMPDMWNACEFCRQSRAENDSGVRVDQIDVLFSDELYQPPNRNKKSVKHQDEPGGVS